MRALEARNFIDEPEAGIVTGLLVLSSRVTQPNDKVEFELFTGHNCEELFFAAFFCFAFLNGTALGRVD